MPTCDASNFSDPHVLELLCSPGVLLAEFQRFLKSHTKYRWCASLKHNAHNAWCEKKMANACSVNALQFCAAPQEDQTSISQAWLRAANVPPEDMLKSGNFPVVPNLPKDDGQNTYVQDSCRITGEVFRDTPNRSQQHLMAQTREDTALAQFLCLQRGKIQQLISNDRTIVSDNMASQERFDRNGYGRMIQKAVATPGRLMDASGALGVGDVASTAIGAAMGSSITASAGLGMVGLLGGYGMRSAYDAATGGPDGRRRRHFEREAQMRALDLRGKELTSPIDTIIWDCLTRTCDNLRLNDTLKVLQGAINESPNVQGEWMGGIQSFFVGTAMFKTVLRNGHQWLQMSPLPRSTVSQDAFGVSPTSLHHPTCTDNPTLSASSFDKNKQILAHLLRAGKTAMPNSNNNNLFKPWATTGLTSTTATMNDMWKLVPIDRSLPSGTEYDTKFVAVAAQPLFVKIGRLISMYNLFLGAQQKLHPKVFSDRLDLSMLAVPNMAGSAPATDVAPLIKMWYFLNPESAANHSQTYLHLDYLWAAAQATVDSTVAPDIDKSAGGFYNASWSRLRVAIDDAQHCNNLLVYEH